MTLAIILLVVLCIAAAAGWRWRAHCAREKAVGRIKSFTPHAITSFFYGRELSAEETGKLHTCLSEDAVARVVSARDLNYSNLSHDEKTHTELCVWCALRVWAKLKSPGSGPLSQLPAFHVLAKDAAAGYPFLQFALSVSQALLAKCSSTNAQALQAATQAASVFARHKALAASPVASRAEAFQLVAQAVLNGRTITRRLKARHI